MADEQGKITVENTEVTPTQNKVEMTQDKLESLINSKYASGAEKATKELLQSIGVDDVDVLKSIVSSHREQEEASKSELQKLQEMIELERKEKAELEAKLTQTLTEREVQNIALEHGINPKYMKYFEMDYLSEKDNEGFELEKFIVKMQEENPIFFGYVDEKTKANIQNPPSKKPSSMQIKMSDYVQLPSSERAKYKASDIIR